MGHKWRLSLPRAARGALVWALSGISKQFRKGNSRKFATFSWCLLVTPVGAGVPEPSARRL